MEIQKYHGGLHAAIGKAYPQLEFDADWWGQGPPLLPLPYEDTVGLA